MLRSRRALLLGATLLVAGCGWSARPPVSIALRAHVARELGERQRGFDAPAKAMDFYVRQRAPFGKPLPAEKYLDAQQHIRNMLASAADDNRRGPRAAASVGGIVGWRGIGPGDIGGRTRALAIHPVDHNIMYAGGVSGGVWKTTDGGQAWTPLDDFLPNLAVATIAIDPTDPEVIYVGTGEGFYPVSSPTTEAIFLRGLGIFKSQDGGATWSHLAATINSNFYYVNDIRISPDDAQQLFAATWRGVYRSLDAGQTWTRVLRGSTLNQVGCTELAVRSDTSPPVMFAAFGSLQSDGIYRSIDHGSTWSKLTTGLPTSDQGRITLAIAPSDQNVMYACIAQNFAGADEIGALQGVYRSVDGGTTWEQRVNLALPVGKNLLGNQLAIACMPGQGYHQGWYDNAIVVDALDPEVVWVGGVDVQRSDDGGVTWGLVSAWWQYTYNGLPEEPNYCHADIHRLLLHPEYDGSSNQSLFVCSDGGIFRTDNPRAATTTSICDWTPPAEVNFTSLNNGYDTIQFYHGDADLASGRLLGGAQDNGSFRATAPDGADWQRTFGGDGGYCAIDPRNPNVLYVEIQFFPQIYKSINGGQTFIKRVTGITGDSGSFINPIAMDQVNPSILWACGNRPWRTTNGANSWAAAGPDFSPGAAISAVAIAPSNHEIVYLGFSDGYVQRSDDALAANPTWVSRSSGLRAGTGYVSWVEIDPVDPDVAYATYSTFGGGKIFKTINGGVSWANVTGSGLTGLPDLPVNCVAINRIDRDLVYAGTDLGVFVSESGGTTWIADDAGLPHTIVESFDWQGSGRLVAFTHGRSVFVTDVRTPLALDDGGPIDAGGAQSIPPPP
ncbi:MAG: hypothetical protein CHACPFDD_00105 [Phycisphaerae bacterium]|nr:hypothetical protein [Phycisphaerae bacterium]